MARAGQVAHSAVLSKIEGRVDLVTFRNIENGYTILKVIGKATGGRATLVGVLPECHPGQEFAASGVWKTHPKFGKQFDAESFIPQYPTTSDGATLFLSGGAFPGIGPVIAQALVVKYGASVFSILDNVGELVSIHGISMTKAVNIAEAWKIQKGKHEVLVFLYGHGVKPAAAEKIFEAYKLDTVIQVTSDPYRCARDIDGIGFLTVDTIGKSLGFVDSHPTRIRAGLEYTLLQAQLSGHCGLPEDRLLTTAADLLQLGFNSGLADLVNLMVQEEDLIADLDPNGSRDLYLPALYRQEASIADAIVTRLGRRPSWAPERTKIAQLIADAELEVGVTLADEQRSAVRNALEQEVSVITGGPGTGKTTLVKVLTAILAKLKTEFHLCAPTGKAAVRLSEATGVPASTVARLIGFGGKPKSLQSSLLILDEGSTLDVPVCSMVLSAARAGQRETGNTVSILIIGDVDQLPSVGPGKVLADLLNSGVVSVTRLNRIFRQGAGSRIAEIAAEIRQGIIPKLMPSVWDGDLLYLEVDDPQDVPAVLNDVVLNVLPGVGYAADDTQVLVPMRRGSLGTFELNIALKAILNPSPIASVKHFGRELSVGDKVMNTKNDYTKNVFNGEVGVVTDVNDFSETLPVSFLGRPVEYPYAETDALMLAYAATVHKFQGSEEKAVVVVLSTQHFPMLKRTLLYTAITRAKQRLVLISSRKALTLAVKTLDGSTRCTRLGKLLKDLGTAQLWLVGNRSA